MITVILPTYNERGNIIRCIRRIRAALKHRRHEILVIDDGSPDGTAAEAARYRFGNVRVLCRKTRGLTSALSYGILHGRGDIICWMDADLSHPPELLPRMIESVSAHDVVVASRYVNGAADRRRERLAVYASCVINAAAARFIPAGITDYTSGYIAVRKTVTDACPLRGDYGEYFINLIADASGLGFKMAEVPYTSVSRVWGRSKTAANPLHFLIKGRKYVGAILQNRRKMNAGAERGYETR